MMQGPSLAGRRVWFGKTLIVLGAVVISLRFNGAATISSPALLLLATCLLWGIDNNLTRTSIAFLLQKGLTAGSFNIALAVVMGQTSLSWMQGSATLTNPSRIAITSCQTFIIDIVISLEFARTLLRTFPQTLILSNES